MYFIGVLGTGAASLPSICDMHAITVAVKDLQSYGIVNAGLAGWSNKLDVAFYINIAGVPENIELSGIVGCDCSMNGGVRRSAVQSSSRRANCTADYTSCYDTAMCRPETLCDETVDEPVARPALPVSTQPTGDTASVFALARLSACLSLLLSSSRRFAPTPAAGGQSASGRAVIRSEERPPKMSRDHPVVDMGGC
jgi:hypothetical protein